MRAAQMIQDSPIWSTCCGGKWDPQEYGVVMEIKESFDSGLGEFHPGSSTDNLPGGSRVPAFRTNTYPEQKANQPVEKAHCSESQL